MARSVVNLDAMIPREDMLSPAAEYRGASVERIDINHLDDGFFVSALRKPDFQRETAHWTPEKVVELVKAFVSGDLIPAVILWRRGANVFVIDGAHRLSALIAWVKDDYGAGKQSLEHFGGRVPEEQQKIAERTKKLINSTVGPYAQFAGAKKNPKNASPEVQAALGNLAANAIVAQWVPKVDERAAEDSFFKINQAATPIDPTERQILQSRTTANAIASRAIVRGGTGHKYWTAFAPAIQAEIEGRAKAIHSALYEPPLGDLPIKTLDVPVAGRGYSALPFIYELVNWANDVPDPTKSKADPLPDLDGSTTLNYLAAVEEAIGLITGTEMKSLGLHPVAYFYTRGGEFQPNAFIATASFVRDLVSKNRLKRFTKARAQIEDFLLSHKEFVTAIIKATGSGRRSLGRLVRYFELLLIEFDGGKCDADVIDAMKSDVEFAFLTAAKSAPIRDGDNSQRRFSRATKTASFLDAATKGALRCGVCGSLLHRNSMQFDHIDEARHGGRTDSKNAQPTHPYCNSAKASLIKT